LWREWFVQPAHRCLIPFTSFAEAEGPDGRKTKTWISVSVQPLAAWARLWRPSDVWFDFYTGVMEIVSSSFCLCLFPFLLLFFVSFSFILSFLFFFFFSFF